MYVLSTYYHMRYVLLLKVLCIMFNVIIMDLVYFLTQRLFTHIKLYLIHCNIHFSSTSRNLREQIIKIMQTTTL